MSQTKSESPVAARESLDAEKAEPVDKREEQAKAQEKQQAEELGRSLSGAGAKAMADLQPGQNGTPAEARAKVKGAVAIGGHIDNVSRRSSEDALEGHFVSIDLSDKGVKEGYKNAGLEDHRGDYGVFQAVGGVDPETGIPETVLVRLRDATNAVVTVPYEACRPAEARGR